MQAFTPSLRYFCPSAIFDYLGGQLGVRHSLGDIWGDKVSKNLQTNNT